MKDSNILQSEVRKTFETLIESGVFTEVRIFHYFPPVIFCSFILQPPKA